MKNGFVKGFFVLAALAVLTGCSTVRKMAVTLEERVIPVALSEKTKTERLEWDEKEEIKSLRIYNLTFTDEEEVGAFLDIREGKTTVELRGSEELWETYGLSAEVKNGELSIGLPKAKTFSGGVFEIAVAGNFESVRLEGSLPLEGNGGEDLSLSVAGASDWEWTALSMRNFSVAIAGAAEGELSGSVEAFSYEVSGAGELDGENCVCQKAELSISGAGKATVAVSDELSVAISGAGSVEYYGSPKVTEKSEGAGSVRQISPELPLVTVGIFD